MCPDVAARDLSGFGSTPGRVVGARRYGSKFATTGLVRNKAVHVTLALDVDREEHAPAIAASISFTACYRVTVVSSPGCLQLPWLCACAWFCARCCVT